MDGSSHHMDSHRRIREVRKVLWIILWLNVGVAVAKMAWGYLSHSAAMVADGFHSLFDGTSNIVALVGLSIAARPADEDHPYGHSKYENYASVVIGLMLLSAAYTIGSQGFSRLLGQGQPVQVSLMSFIVIISTIAVNIFVTTYESRVGKRLKSEILIADAAHTRSDVLVSLGVLVSLVLVKLGFEMADAIVSIFIAVMILYTAWGVFKQANETLSDKARISIDELRDVVHTVPGAIDCHEIRTRGTEAEVYLDMHLVVDPHITVLQGHEISHQVEHAVTEAFPLIVDVTIHVEPEGYEFIGENPNGDLTHPPQHLTLTASANDEADSSKGSDLA